MAEQQNKLSISIIGLGYVGLPTAMYFANSGVHTYGVEIDKRKAKLIGEGKSPIQDDFIIETLPRVLGKTFEIHQSYEVITKSDIILIILPTPVDDSKKPNLSFIKFAGKEIAKYLRKNQLVILESTVYPGVTEETLLPILEQSGLLADRDFGLAYCPERFNPGDINNTIDKTVRVIGANSEKWRNIAESLYSRIQRTHQTTSIKTAEMSKVIENTQRDLNIALMNELALICERMDLDIQEVLDAAFTKWNFGHYFPGPGVGGHCLPHDPYYLVNKAEEVGYKARIIIAGRELNDGMPLHIFDLLSAGLNEQAKSINGSKIAIFGATYKANIDDIRTSPTKTLVTKLRSYKAEVLIIEPNVDQEFIFGYPNYTDFNKLDFQKIDAIVIMVDHTIFKTELKDYLEKTSLSHMVVVDGKRFLNKERVTSNVFKYLGLGNGR